VLRVMCLALMMVVAAVASLNVALPGIARATARPRRSCSGWWMPTRWPSLRCSCRRARSATASGASRS
jgi:hypothetical protein